MIDGFEIITDKFPGDLARRIYDRVEFHRKNSTYEVDQVKYSTYYNTDEKQAYHCAMLVYKKKVRKNEL